MPEIVILTVIAFTIGYMSRPRLEGWWYRNKPVHCPECNHWAKWMHTIPAQHRVAGRVRICNRCWARLYHPKYEDQQ